MQDGRSSTGAGAHARFSWFRITIICLALLLEGMSASSINVQVAAVRTALGIGPVELGLVVAAFLVAYAGLLPVAGNLIDARGRRRVFLLGVILFGVGCLICAAALTGWMLGLGRFVQGAGAALSAPAALALITQRLPAGPILNRRVALYGSMGAAGFSLGLVLPGFVVDLAGWRASFLIAIPIILIVLWVAWSVRDQHAVNPRPVDLRGAALLTSAMVVAVFTIATVGTLPLLTLAVPTVAVALLAGLLIRRGGLGGYPAQVVRSKRVLAACVALAAVFAGEIPAYYMLSLALQEGYGHSPFTVGLMILPKPLAFALLAGYGARLVTHYGARRVLTTGMLLITASLAYLALNDPTASYLTGMLPAQIALGAGLAMTFPAASIAAVNATSDAHRGTTASLLTTSQNIGGAMGLALVTALALVPQPGQQPDTQPGLITTATIVLAGGIIAALITHRSGARSPANVDLRWQAS